MRPAAIQPIGLIGFIVFSGFKFFVHFGLEGSFHIFNFAFGYQPILDQPFGVKRKRGLLSFDLIIH